MFFMLTIVSYLSYTLFVLQMVNVMVRVGSEWERERDTCALMQLFNACRIAGWPCCNFKCQGKAFNFELMSSITVADFASSSLPPLLISRKYLYKCVGMRRKGLSLVYSHSYYGKLNGILGNYGRDYNSYYGHLRNSNSWLCLFDLINNWCPAFPRRLTLIQNFWEFGQTRVAWSTVVVTIIE